MTNGYYDRVEAQLRALTEHGAHRRTRLRVAPIVAVGAAAAVVLVVAGVFIGARGRSHPSPASRPPVCTLRDWRMSGMVPRYLDDATVTGVAIRTTTSCRLRVNIASDLLNRSGAVASSIGARVDSVIFPGSQVERRWAWRNACGGGASFSTGGPFWFRLSSGARAVTIPVRPPPCVSRRDPTGFVPFELSSPDVLSGNGIGDARLGMLVDQAPAAVSNLLGVFGDPIAAHGCGVDSSERMLDHIVLFFGQRWFVGFEYSGRFLKTTAGLGVGETVARARQLYGPAFRVSTAHGGSWSANGLRGYLTGPRNGRIETIDAGNVGCATASP
jgi:hypothetical protein